MNSATRPAVSVASSPWTRPTARRAARRRHAAGACSPPASHASSSSVSPAPRAAASCGDSVAVPSSAAHANPSISSATSIRTGS
eukprot:3900642-Pleurochrysis_carterae.AAC.1